MFKSALTKPGVHPCARLGPFAAAVLLGMFNLVGCAGAGPAAIGYGRSAYNTMINETEDQQILSMIVRQRYGETFGMLAVSSVTASLRTSASVGTNVGIGPRSGYEGNLVPLSAEALYEVSPTISYVPLRGEQFIQRMLAPISAEQALLLSRMSTEEVEVLRLLVRRVNGIDNPLFASRPAAEDREAFNRFTNLYVRLRERGILDLVQSAEQQYQMLFHSYTEDDLQEIAELLSIVNLAGEAEGAELMTVPLWFSVGGRRPDGVSLETASALEVIRVAALGVDVPDEHVADGFAQASKAHTPDTRLITIQSSRKRPSDASVMVKHKDWWFFVDGRDRQSKHAFMFLRTLIGIRLNDDALGPSVPALTLPIAR